MTETDAEQAQILPPVVDESDEKPRAPAITGYRRSAPQRRTNMLASKIARTASVMAA